ncbi:Hypothetical protein D9617_2g052620 [Elsinoe fawcettii]|nr:Hypothetical protein D9617_2g052620 [Elsinoe fawcettii]
MVEIAAFVRRRSARKSLCEDELFLPAETTETTATRSNSTFTRRLTKRQTDPGYTHRSDSTPRGSRNSLVDLTRKSFERRSFRSSALFSEPGTPEGEYKSHFTGIVEEPLDINSPDTPDNDDMSAELLKTVAKKTSLKNILCDKQGEDDGIDLDAAIHLLQELKKKASPEELVALHRALLPTKPGSARPRTEDAVVSPYSRRSSMVTPGLATRSKSPGKSPKETIVPASPLISKKSKPRPLSEQLAISVMPKPGALPRQTSCMDLPPHKGVPSLSRSYSPADLDVSAIGGLRLGTLRVTNGAVSPEPSIISEADDSPTMTRATHGRSFSEPQAQVNWTAEEIADLRDESVTPRPTNPVGREDADLNRRSVIPGLDAYSDSSEDEMAVTATPRSQGIQFADNNYQTNSTGSGLYKKPAFNLSVGSVISRLSTIEDNESLAERARSPSLMEERIQSPTFAFERLTGQPLHHSPPPSSGSDTSSLYPATIQRLSPLHSNPRPVIPAKLDSGYASEIQMAGGRGSSDSDSLDSIPMFPRPANYQLAKRSNCQLETIPSVSDILSSVPSEAGGEDDAGLQLSDTMTAPDVPRKDHLSPPPMQRNPASSSSSIPSVISELDYPDARSTEKMAKPRKKLYKPPPVKRNSSTDVLSPPMSPSMYPTVPDEMSVNFSRRICRAPGSYHPEHTFAALSRESLERVEQMKEPPKTPKMTDTAKMATPTKNALPSSEPNSAEPELQKKKSRFRLRGRSRSKSLARPEANLPREQDTPTVAETVPQFAEIVKAKEIDITAERRQRSASRPRFHADFSVKEYGNDYPAIERVTDQRWSPRMPQESFDKANDYKRSGSVPKALTPGDRRQSTGGERSGRNDEAARRQRSKSVAANVHRAMRDDADDELTAIPKTPKNKIIGQDKATPQEAQSEPKKPQEPPRKERRNTFERVFLRGSSKDRSSRSGSRSNSRSPKIPDVNSPAYIASRFPSPPPDPNRLASSQPRTIPWEADKTPSKPRSGQATPTSIQGKTAVSRNDSAVSASSVHAPISKHNKSAVPRTAAPLTSISTNVQTVEQDADGTYRAYRISDAVSITKLTSPTKESPRAPPSVHRARVDKPLHQVQQDRLNIPHKQGGEKRWSHASDAAPSPESLFDRFGGGLDYGWDRGNGFTGSAGTRSGASEKAHRKSLVLSESYGVDLSDVPVFVKRV